MHATYPSAWRSRRVTLAHDWLTGMRGGERVLELLADGFPAAPICTLIHHPPAVSARLNAHPVVTSPLQRLPGVSRYYRRLLPWFPWAAGRVAAPPCDLLLSTSHCVAKGIRPPPGARHVSYCFTPMRYAWTFFAEYFGRNPIKKTLLRPLLRRLRAWDLRTNDRVDVFVTLSRHVQDRIRRFYNRDSEVVYPPADLEFFTPDPAGGGRGGFDLIVSALVPYKRIDLAVRAYTRIGRPLRIAGVGSEASKLRRLAGPNVTFLGWQPDEAIRGLYRACRLLVFPGEEDFGLVPVEAQACGRPVVAYRRGGALESVEEGVTGLFFDEQTEKALIDAVGRAAGRDWDAGAIRRQAERFGAQRFVEELERVMSRLPELRRSAAAP